MGKQQLYFNQQYIRAFRSNLATAVGAYSALLRLAANRVAKLSTSTCLPKGRSLCHWSFIALFNIVPKFKIYFKSKSTKTDNYSLPIIHSQLTIIYFSLTPKTITHHSKLTTTYLPLQYDKSSGV